jgi:predicted MFS family arabinose efflux permease
LRGWRGCQFEEIFVNGSITISLPKAGVSVKPRRPTAISAAGANRTGTLTALFIAGFATFVNLYATQPLLPHLREIFHASEFMVSLTVSAPILAVALSASWLGLVADSMGRKRVIVTSIFAMAIPTVLSATASNLHQLIGWRFLQGLFTPGIVAVAMAYISEETPGHLAGSTMSIYLTGAVVGGFCGRFSSGLIAARWGWQASMVVLGIATFAGALLTWWIMPRSRNFVPHHNVAESIASLRSHLHNPQLLATYAVGFNVLFCLAGVFTYVNFYLADPPFLLGPAALASIFAVYLIGAAVTPYSGRLLDKIGHRRLLVGSSMIVSSGMLLTLLHNTPMVVAGLACAAVGAFASQVGASTYVGQVARQARSSASGLYVAFYYLGGCAGSALPGLFWKKAGWLGCVGLMIFMQAVIALIAIRVWKNKSPSKHNAPAPPEAASILSH